MTLIIMVYDFNYSGKISKTEAIKQFEKMIFFDVIKKYPYILRGVE